MFDCATGSATDGHLISVLAASQKEAQMEVRSAILHKGASH